MQIKSLKDISEIIAGYTFREALVNDSNGRVSVVLAKNINDDGTINYGELTQINLKLPRTNSFIINNDILLSSRGIFRAGVFIKNENKTIASSSLYILRLKNSEVLSKYLSIYFNSEIGQIAIKRNLTGSTIKTILKSSLENLLVPVPALQIQKMIIEIDDNWRKQEKLLNQKINLSKSITEATIKQLIIK